MKKLFFIVTIFIFSMNGFSNPLPVADTTRINGKLVLTLCVDGYAAGFGYGYLLGSKIADLLENYVINNAFGGATHYLAARQLFDAHFIYADKYGEIAQGMIDGMESAGVSLFSPTLGENLTYKDILIANSIPDFTSFGLLQTDGPGCSELMSWGEATAVDPELNGEMVISRNLDWDNNPLLINNALIIIWDAPSGNNQRIITFGFVGLIGALSGINESGVATFQNMGNYNYSPIGTDFYPVNLAQRDGLESWDYNSDGVCSSRDVSDAVRAHHVSSTFIISSAGPDLGENPAEILEIHNSFGDTIRTIQQNPEFFGDNLVATNHFRLLKPPAYCSRYSRISDSLQASNQLGVLRNWRVLQTAGVTTNLQTIQYIPFAQKLRFSFAEIGIPAYQIEPTEVWLDTIFNPVGINEINPLKTNLIEIFPNPCSRHNNLGIRLPESGTFLYEIFDLTGNVVYNSERQFCEDTICEIGWGSSDIPLGVYFCSVEFVCESNGKIINETKKIIVSR